MSFNLTNSSWLILTNLEVVSGLAPPAVLASRVEAVQRAGVDVLAGVVDDHREDDNSSDVGDLKHPEAGFYITEHINYYQLYSVRAYFCSTSLPLASTRWV